MAVKTVVPRLNLAAAQAAAVTGYSSNIWSDCPIAEIREGTVEGIIFEDDFVSFNKTPATTEGNWASNHGYAQFSSTGGTITAGSGQGGEAVFASDGDDEGASIRSLAVPFKISRDTKKLWFEARCKFSTIADSKNGVFIGLMDNRALTAIMPLTAAGALADANLVGFHRLEGDGDKLDTVYKADGVTAVSVQTDAVTLEADTYVRIGFVYEPGVDPLVHDTGLTGAGKYLLSFYANNVRLGTTKQIPSAAGTDFPNDVGLGFVFALLNATATTPGDATIDKVRIVQLL